MGGFPSTWKHAERQIRQVKACSQTTHQTDRREEERRGEERERIYWIFSFSFSSSRWAPSNSSQLSTGWLAGWLWSVRTIFVLLISIYFVDDFCLITNFLQIIFVMLEARRNPELQGPRSAQAAFLHLDLWLTPTPSTLLQSRHEK